MRKILLLTLFTLFHWEAYGAAELPSPHEVRGVELILATGSSDSLNTRFGHLFIRLVDRDKSWANDVVINFGFESEEQRPSGLEKIKHTFQVTTGEYPLVMTIAPMGEFWTRYELGQKRNLHRFILPTNSHIRENILQNIKNWRRYPEKLGRYTLLGQNCASQVIELLQMSEVPTLTSPLIGPQGLDEYLTRSRASFFPPLKMNSKQQAFQDLNLTENDSLFFSEKEFQKVLKDFTDEQLRVLLTYQLKLNLGMIKEIREKRGVRLNTEDFDRIIGMIKLPNEVYQLCEHRECVFQKMKTMERLLGKEHIKTMKKNLASRPTSFRRHRRGSTRNRELDLNRVQTLYEDHYEQEYLFAKDLLGLD